MNRFDEYLEKYKQSGANVKNAAIVGAGDRHTLEAVYMAADDGVITPIAIGDKSVIESLLHEMGRAPGTLRIIDADSPERSAEIAIEVTNNGEADLIVKGKIETKPLMQAIIDKKNNLRTDRIISHIGFNHINKYHKLIAVTDCAINIAPDLEQKRQILDNAVEALAKMGIKNPKVGVVAVSEELNASMAESVDALALKEDYLAGKIQNCIVEGPISLDLALDPEAAAIKGYKSPVAGDVDLLLMPNLTTGNIFGKTLIYTEAGMACGFVAGAKVPIVLVSRASPVQDKYYSIILAAMRL